MAAGIRPGQGWRRPRGRTHVRRSAGTGWMPARARPVSAGIAAWGSYLPLWRLQRAAIGSVLGSGGGRGTRSVASYDEDTTTLGVEAGRRALATGPGAGAVQDLFFSTPDPGYLDKTSATTVHAALGLTRGCGAYDFAGSARSAVATLLQAFAAPGSETGAGRTT